MTKSLRHDLLAIWIAIIALTSQMFFGLVHTTTLWVAAAGPVAQVETGSVAASFLEICSAGGLVTLDGEEDNEAQFDPTKCPVCSSAATAPLLDTTPPVPVLLEKPAEIQIVELETQSSDQRVDRIVFARGPPSLA
nr:hypothetical protein [uncultured Cohaesibacter sp.]